MRVTLFPSLRSRRGRPYDVTLAELLGTPVAAPAKDAAPLWSPTTFDADTVAAAYADTVSAIVLDYDDGTDPDAASAPWADVAHGLHASASDSPHAPRFRLVVPLKDPTPAAAWPRVWAWAVARSAGAPDPACRDVSRRYYVPCVLPGRAPPWWREHAGPLLVLPADLPPPPAGERRSPPGFAPSPHALPPAVLEDALRVWRARLEDARLALTGMARCRRTSLARYTYWLAGHAWLAPGLLEEAFDALLGAARVNGLHAKHPTNTEALVHDTLAAGAADPIPVDDLVPLPRAPDGQAPPLVVKYRSGYWVRRDAADAPADPATGVRYDGTGRYDGPTDARGLIPLLRDRGDTPATDVRAGRPVPWSPETVLYRWGAHAAAVELVLPDPLTDAVATPWDPLSRTLRVTRAGRVPLEPAWDPDVDRWLHALLGDGPCAEAAWRWLRAADVDTPTAALYLEGPPGVGKSLLASALAARWGTAPVPLEVAIGTYPVPVASCPVVLLDEGTTLDARGTAAFRLAVSERAHVLNEKHLPHVVFRGALKIVIAANNADALGIREIRSLADLDAIAERVLHVPVHAAAGDVLRAVGTAGWVDGPGRLVRHLAWLATSPPPGEGRWAVAGVRGPWHEGLLWRVPLYAAILGAIASGAAAAPTPDWTASDGAYAIRLRALLGRWERYVEDVPRPTTSALARALDGLSRRPAEAGTWYVDEALVTAYARSVGA